MPTYNKPPPDQRSNWHRLNEGQRRYAWEQYNLALVRRGIPINHPVPERDRSPVRPAADDIDLDAVLAEPHPDEQRVADEVEADIRTDELPTAEDILNNLPDVEEDAVQDIDESHFESSGEMSAGQHSFQSPDTSRGTPKRAGGPPQNVDAAKRRLIGTGRDQGSSGNPLGEDSARPFRLPKPIISIQHNVNYYRKVHRMFTYGLAYNPNAGDSESIRYITTPLGVVPWDWLGFYLNPSEHALLPSGSSVSKVKCTVYQRNVRVAFPVNASTSTGLATLNQNKDIIYAIGLNKAVDTFPAQLTPGTGDNSMKPTVGDKLSTTHIRTYVDQWYGKSMSDTIAPRHQFGQPFNCQHYAVMVYNINGEGDTPDGWECLQSHINEADADSTSGGELVSVEYHPKVGLCTNPKTPVVRNYPRGGLSIIRGSHVLEKHATNINITDTPEVLINTSSAILSTVPATGKDVIQQIEKCQDFGYGLFNLETPAVQPSLHVGVQPVRSTSFNAANPDASFVDVQAFFEIVAECWIDTNYSTYRPLTTQPNVRIGNRYIAANASLRYGDPLLDGLYTSDTQT